MNQTASKKASSTIGALRMTRTIAFPAPRAARESDGVETNAAVPPAARAPLAARSMLYRI